MIYATGDTHGNFQRFTPEHFPEQAQKAKFHYWLFGHYHDNRMIDDRFVLLWEQMVQVV